MMGIKRIEKISTEEIRARAGVAMYNTVGTPNFVSSYRLQPVVNDSDLLSGWDFASLTHRSHRVS